MRDGRLSPEARDRLLADMTEDVAALVLRNYYLQSLALSLAERRGLEDLGFEQRLMQTLEAASELDRSVEFLPDDMELSERRRRSQALTRPELAVLLAYAKLSLNRELLTSNVPDDPYLGRELERYFPEAVRQQFPDAVSHHRLRREIIATQLANSMINRGGPSLLVRIADQTGASPARIAAAFAAVRDSYGMTALNGEIDALDNKISGKLQLELYRSVQDLLLDRLVWFVRNVELAQGLAAIVTHYREGIAQVEAALDSVLPEAAAAARRRRKTGSFRTCTPSTGAHGTTGHRHVSRRSIGRRYARTRAWMSPRRRSTTASPSCGCRCPGLGRSPRWSPSTPARAPSGPRRTGCRTSSSTSCSRAARAIRPTERSTRPPSGWAPS
jgi:glutamate dehydrogenase